jgi:hypothetical protein
MSDAEQTVDDRPKTTYTRVYLLSLVLIALGLSAISWRVVMILGVVFMPAHAIAIGLISRVKPWRPVLLKIWPVTALVIALLFLMPGHVIYRLALTPNAVFKRLVANPVPKTVENIEKKEGGGPAGWVSLTFDADAGTIAELLVEREYQPVENVSAEIQEKAGRIQMSGSHGFQKEFPESGIRFSAIVNARSNRMSVIYERGVR